MTTTPARPRILPTIDVLDRAQAVRNAEVAFALGVDGIFFNNADDDDGLLYAVASQLRETWPDKLIGAGYATLGPTAALERSLRCKLDATWTARRDITSQGSSADAVEAAGILKAHGRHSFFASVTTLGRSDDPRAADAAARAWELGMVPTASGEQTGWGPAHTLKAIRGAIGDAPLALAGYSASTCLAALPVVPSHFFVATAAGHGFQYLDPDQLRACMSRVAAAEFVSHIGER